MRSNVTTASGAITAAFFPGDFEAEKGTRVIMGRGDNNVLEEGEEEDDKWGCTRVGTDAVLVVDAEDDV